jgi:DNA-binding response OmpR family regulator
MSMSGTILVVEDEPALRQLLAGALSVAGYRVHQARNGAEAAAVFERHGTEIDLLITDLLMPFVDGQELIDKLRARRNSLKVLGISGTRQAPMTVDGFIAKPFSRDAFLAQVSALLDPR